MSQNYNLQLKKFMHAEQGECKIVYYFTFSLMQSNSFFFHEKE